MGFPDPKRSSFGLARIDNELILIGGHQGEYHDYQGANWSRAVHAVRLDSLSHHALPSYPETVQGLRAVMDGNDVIAFGGFVYDPGLDVGLNKITYNWFARSISDVRVLTPGADHWDTILRMPKQRSSNVAEKIGNKVYLLGGWDGSTELKTDAAGNVKVDTGGRWHNTIDIFDCTSRRFVPNLIKFPNPLRRAFSSTVLNGQIVMVGGISPDYGPNPAIPPLNNVTVFDPATETFSDTAVPPFKRKVFAPSICTAGDSLVVLGGMDENFSASDEVWVYRKGAADWVRNKTDLKGADMFMESVELASDRILVIGGHSTVDKTPLGFWRELQIAT